MTPDVPAICAPRRVQLSRKKGGRMPENTVSVARPGRWGNPFGIANYGLRQSLEMFHRSMHGVWSPYGLPEDWSDEKFSIAYRSHIAFCNRLGSMVPIERAKRELHGKNLACWCPPEQPCHADILLAMANAPAHLLKEQQP